MWCETRSSESENPHEQVIGMPLIIGIHPRVLFTRKGNGKHGHTEKAGRETNKRNDSVVVAETLD